MGGKKNTPCIKTIKKNVYLIWVEKRLAFRVLIILEINRFSEKKKET